MNVKKLRQAMGLSQEAFADHLGVERRTISRWETATTKQSPLAQRQLAALKRSFERRQSERQVAVGTVADPPSSTARRPLTDTSPEFSPVSSSGVLPGSE